MRDVTDVVMMAREGKLKWEVETLLLEHVFEALERLERARFAIAHPHTHIRG